MAGKKHKSTHKIGLAQLVNKRKRALEQQPPGAHPDQVNPAETAASAIAKRNRDRYPTLEQSQYVVCRSMEILGFEADSWNFAPLIGAPYGTVRRWTRGESRPTSKYLNRINTLLLCHIDGIAIDEAIAIRWDEAPMTAVWKPDSQYAISLADDIGREMPNPPDIPGRRQKMRVNAAGQIVFDRYTTI